ncbi:hypothetical protein CFD26_102194 [Aspergillus turcosus]|uniref:Cation-transporting ATPase n=1 Tax=Aspergillus turcosus TaxID=1245748 RepID=A0A3R7JGF0_9EURO|nr:hypothetical protein CFD26_102194 [Aspergillus turcosus]
MRSSYSIVSDVEMARTEVFDGPISESIPSSVVSFAHRRGRKDSTVSFTYFQEEDGFIEWPREEVIDAESEIDELSIGEGSEADESIISSRRSKRLSYSRLSAEDPLLPRRPSSSFYTGERTIDSRLTQKVYIVSEDLTIVIAGFSTSSTGVALYYLLCIFTLGFAYILLRWLPRWRVRLIGKPTPLRLCQWVAVEVGFPRLSRDKLFAEYVQDQWNQFSICEVLSIPYGRVLSTVFADSESCAQDEDQDSTVPYLRYIDYRCLRFFYHPVDDKFSLISGWKDPLWTNIKRMRIGLDADDHDSRAQIFGANVIDIQQKSVIQLLIDEAFHPFYIFQIASLVLWSLDEYYYYAVCIFLISVFSICATILETQTTMKRLREISLFECDTRVLRNGFCESVPVSKIPLTDDALKYLNLSTPSIHPNVAKHFLFSGTKVIRARRPHSVEDDEAIALAVVVRTGFSTTKGALVRSMLFPKPSGFKFYKDSFRYITVMGVVAAVGFIASFVNFVRLGLSWHLIIVRALDLITIVVPPALPATLTIGTNLALSRLKGQKIFCISPQRVNIAGKLDIVCFDKTGTLTEDGLDVLGVRTVNQDLRFSDLKVDLASVTSTSSSCVGATAGPLQHKNIVHAMATCHSLRVVDGELMGDPLDVKMFQFTGWSYQENGSQSIEPHGPKYETITPPIARPPNQTVDSGGQIGGSQTAPIELGVLRNFEFVSELRRASVVVRQFGDGGASFFVKGAPESLKTICLPDSLPHDFDELLSYYTHKGYRVIACAARYEPKLSWMKAQKLTRELVERDLEFIGFIIFENKLKSSTTGTIAELSNAGIRNVMCTGDNILTAVSVARECGLIRADEQCFIPRFAEGHNHDIGASLVWECVDDPALNLDPSTLLPSLTPTDVDLSVPAVASNINKYSLAISGDVFRWLVDFGSDVVLKRMLVRGNVFARMSPDEKHELVERLQSLDYCCGFCGDGANDCGALKAADVGISLSDAEASVAAPFTSRQFDISCVPQLIKEGRAALVTSFCCFKYMSLYSAIQFSSVSFLYTSASNLGDFQFLFIDLALILPIAIFMGWTGPYPVLSRKRPTANLVSRKVLTPLLGQISICILTQFVAFKTIQSQPWFQPPKIDLDNSNIKNSENTALFLISIFQYIFTSIVLSVGPPFRMPMRANEPLIVTIVVDSIVSSYMLFDPPEWIIETMQLTFVSRGFAFWLFALAISTFLLSLVAERKFFPILSRTIGHLKTQLRPGTQKQRRQYKNRILHRDMKAANLLISNNGILQIADFGLARPYDEPPPQPGKGGGEAKRDYTTLVVTRWYRPPELLLQLRRYTTAIDMWGVGCVFGEMFKGKPILAGSSDLNQAQLIFNLVGTPTEENMPGWSSLPGCEGVKSFGYKPGSLREVFRDQSPTAISLLGELLKLDWRKRINAIDAINHPYFSSPPLPARPGELPSFEDSHEFDRRRFRGQRGAIPPAPAGGSVGMGPNSGWATNSGPRPATDNRNSRIPGAARVGRLHAHGNQNHPTKRPFESRNAVSHGSLNAGESIPGFSLGSKDGGLPPKPPASARQSWTMGHSNRATRERGQRHHFGGLPDGKLDSVILGTDMLQEDEAGVLTFERLGQKIEHCIDDDELVLVREIDAERLAQLDSMERLLQFQSAGLSFDPKFVPYSAGKECIYRPREAMACTYFALYLRRARTYKYNTRSVQI